MTWDKKFMELFARCGGQYQQGNKDFNTYYSDEDLKFLQSIGYKPREFFDFVEDYMDGFEPFPETALLIAAVRRDYFLVVQAGKTEEGPLVSRDSIPAKDSVVEGITYLPRMIEKAEAKLRGHLDPDLMFCCGGDRRCLRENGDIHPADFLRRVWAADGDHQKVVDWVKTQK